MKSTEMRFFFLASLVAGALAFTCGDVAGDSSNTAYTCPTGYATDAGASATNLPSGDNSTTDANRDACCNGNVNASITPTGFGLIANSNYAAAVSVTIGTALTAFACDAGYSVAKKADGTTDISITFGAVNAADGAFTTITDDDNSTAILNSATCVANTYTAVTPTGFGLIAGSNYAAPVDVTVGTALTAFACNAGWTVAKKADTTTDISITFGAVNAADGAFTTITDDDNSTAVLNTATCVANTYTAVTPTGFGLIANSNYKAAVDVTVGTALAAFACDTGFAVAKKADGTTDISITFGDVNAADGAFTTVTDDDNTTALTAAATCVASATGTGTGSAGTGSAGSAGSAADGSTASPAALAAAGMAAIALLL